MLFNDLNGVQWSKKPLHCVGEPTDPTAGCRIPALDQVLEEWAAMKLLMRQPRDCAESV